MIPKFILIVESGNLRREIPVTDAPLVLGRGPTAGVDRIEDPGTAVLTDRGRMALLPTAHQPV